MYIRQDMILLLFQNTWILPQLRQIFFYNTTFPYGMIFTKDDVSTSDEKVEKLTRELNIHYRDCIVLLMYLLSTRADLSFAAQKLESFH